MNTFEQIYEVVKKGAKGEVASDGQIATILGQPKMARQVGWALHVNPTPGIIPCHRIVTKQGNVASGFAFGGGNAQREMLSAEGVKFDENNLVLKEYFVEW